MINQDLKQRVILGIKAEQTTFSGSASKHAVRLGINPAVYSRLMAGDTDKVLGNDVWISLARQLGINPRNQVEWKTAETEVFKKITAQLKHCQKNSISSLLCDSADIGKTYTAKQYVKHNANAVLIDCSQVKSKQKLVRQIAKDFGVNHTGKYADVYADLCWYINSLEQAPLIILDEAGDLLYDAFLELKALWNATEGNCGWYMMGADGLKEKIRRAIANNKVGYTELFSRFGKRYQRATPQSAKEAEEFAYMQAALIIKANAPQDANIKAIIHKSESSLRRIYTELSKIA